MASITPSVDTAVKALREEGFIILDDCGVGDRVSEMEQKGFPFISPYGLDYYKQNILDNTVRVHSIRPHNSCSLMTPPSTFGWWSSLFSVGVAWDIG